MLPSSRWSRISFLVSKVERNLWSACPVDSNDSSSPPPYLYIRRKKSDCEKDAGNHSENDHRKTYPTIVQWLSCQKALEIVYKLQWITLSVNIKAASAPPRTSQMVPAMDDAFQAGHPLEKCQLELNGGMRGRTHDKSKFEPNWPSIMYQRLVVGFEWECWNSGNRKSKLG